MLDRIDGVDARENLRKLRGHRFARVRVLLVAQKAPREGLALDPLHDKERGAQIVGVLGKPEHLGNLDPLFERGAKDQEFMAAAGAEILRAGIAPQHHRAPIAAPLPLHRAVK